MYRAYKIQEGDNLEIISEKVNCSKEELERLNSDVSFIEGEMITVPTENTLFDIYVVEKGDSIYSISLKYNIPYKELLLLNGLKENEYIYPNQQLLVPKNGVNFYITKENDRIKDIVSNLGVDGYEVLTKNDNLIIMPDQIIVY